MSQTRAAVVGAFVVGGVALFALGLFLIGDRRLLFADRFELSATFGRVTGLEVGTRVRVAGLEAGEVLEIGLPAGPSDRFRVRMRMRRDIQHLVRSDSVGAIQTDGIVGNAFIQVSPGTDAAAMVSDGDTITGRDPIELSDLIEEGRDTFRTVTTEIISLKNDFSRAISTLDDTVMNVNSRVSEIGDRTVALTERGVDVLTAVNETATDVRQIVGDVRAGRGSLGQFLTDDALYTRVGATVEHIEEAGRNLRATTDAARAIVEDVTAPTGAGRQLFTGLRSTLDEALEVVSDLSEGTEALKRNFLFRGFFRERGFFDIDTLSRDAYKQGALEGQDRTALRIWLAADALFTRNAQGIEMLSDEGRRRIDSAMLDLGRFPRDSALVVEGHTRAGEGTDVPVVQSMNRAEAVREYLLRRYRRRTTLTGTIALDDAPESPSGDGRWSGVALALFVRSSTLQGGSR